MSQVMINQSFLSSRLAMLTADLTSQHVYAIVNAPNSTLLGGSVDSAIHEAGGRKFWKLVASFAALVTRKDCLRAKQRL